MRLPVPPPPSPPPELLQQQLAQQPQLVEEQLEGSPAGGSIGKACLPCNALATAAGSGSSPRKASGGGRCKCGSSSSTAAAPHPSWGGLYIAACTCWPTMALRILEVAVPLLLLLLPSGRSTGSALLQAAWRGGAANVPTPSTQLCLAALQLLCTWQASMHASWRWVMATDAVHLALVAGAHS